jgi:hypothetical protein
VVVVGVVVPPVAELSGEVVSRPPLGGGSVVVFVVAGAVVVTCAAFTPAPCARQGRLFWLAERAGAGVALATVVACRVFGRWRRAW